MSYIKLWSFAVDFILVIWYFYPVRPSSPTPLSRQLLGTLPFLLLLPIYLYALRYNGSLADTLLRFVLRVMVYTGFVYWVKGRNLSCSLYLGTQAWLICTAANCIFLTPLFYELRTSVGWFSLLLEFLFTALILTLCSRLIPLNEILKVGSARRSFLVVLTAVQLYVKASLAALSPEVILRQSPVLTSYPLLLQVLLLCAVIFFERYLYARFLRESERISDVANRYRYEYAQVSADADANLRQVHHDLKNHLYALRRLAKDPDGKVDAYIQSLLQDLNDYESLVHTGNELLDGLLSHKIRLARSQQIAISTHVDFSRGSFMKDKDLCALFGNALDNAIEASTRVSQPELRSILVKCGAPANQLLLSVMNYYEGELLQAGPHLLSRKQEPGHGVGLSSIRRTAELYGGSVTFRTDEFHNFVLTVRIPIPDQTPSGTQKIPAEFTLS